MSGAAICDISPDLVDIEDIIGADDATPRERYHNKPVPVPKVRKTKKTKCEVSSSANSNSNSKSNSNSIADVGKCDVSK